MPENGVLLLIVFGHITNHGLVRLGFGIVDRDYVGTVRVRDVLLQQVVLQPPLHVELVLQLAHAHLRRYFIFTGCVNVHTCQVFMFYSMPAF